jgi:hypothetical protein
MRDRQHFGRAVQRSTVREAFNAVLPIRLHAIISGRVDRPVSRTASAAGTRAMCQRPTGPGPTASVSAAEESEHQPPRPTSRKRLLDASARSLARTDAARPQRWQAFANLGAQLQDTDASNR